MLKGGLQARDDAYHTYTWVWISSFSLFSSDNHSRAASSSSSSDEEKPPSSCRLRHQRPHRRHNATHAPPRSASPACGYPWPVRWYHAATGRSGRHQRLAWHAVPQHIMHVLIGCTHRLAGARTAASGASTRLRSTPARICDKSDPSGGCDVPLLCCSQLRAEITRRRHSVRCVVGGHVHTHIHRYKTHTSSMPFRGCSAERRHRRRRQCRRIQGLGQPLTQPLLLRHPLA